MTKIDTSKYLYQLVGGEYNDMLLTYAELEERKLIAGFTEDLTEIRAKGILCKRKELDNQPIVNGYLPPMYNGRMFLDKEGALKYDFEIKEENRVGKAVEIIRYETQKVYDILSQ